MANELQIGALTAAPGEKTFGVNEFTVARSPYRLPMWLINGREDGPTLVVTGGVHAAEYASIAAALEVGRTLTPDTLRGRVVVVPVMNLAAFAARSIYVCPLDGKNLNRVFPGNPDGTASEEIAAWVFQHVIARADYYVDLHGGDLVEALVPFTIFFRSGDARVDDRSLAMAKAFGIRYLVASETPGSTFCAASRAGIPSILAESGGQGIWRPRDVGLLTDGVRRLLRHLDLLPGGAPPASPFTLLEQFLWLRSDHDGFWYPGVEVDDVVQKGQELGRITDVEGRTLQLAASPADGRILFIVSSLAINRTDPLLAVGA
jgi:predicted deacylase